MTTFAALTDNLLAGLNWGNVLVAGGIVLSTLLCTNHKADSKKYRDSDIDVYIYGLGPVEANAKVKHIYKIWKSNLPRLKDGSLPEYRVLRNARTITYVGFMMLSH